MHARFFAAFMNSVIIHAWDIAVFQSLLHSCEKEIESYPIVYTAYIFFLKLFVVVKMLHPVFLCGYVKMCCDCFLSL